MANKNFGVEAIIIPTVTTNFATRRGSLPGLVDGPGQYSAWTPNGGNVTGSNVYGPFQELGWQGSTAALPPGSGNEGLHITYDFGQPVSVAACRYIASSGTMLGAFKLQVSQGGAVWRDFYPQKMLDMYQGNPLYFGRRLSYDNLPGWNVVYGIVPYYIPNTYTVVDPLGPFAGWPWWMDENAYINSLFFRYWRLIGISHGSQYTGNTERHPFNALDIFDPIDGRGTQESLPYDIYALDFYTAQANEREFGRYIVPGIPSGNNGSGFFTSAGVLVDPMNDRAGGRWDDATYYDLMVPPDGQPIVMPPIDPTSPGLPGGSPIPNPHGAPVSKPSDFFHPYSRGVRGPGKYDPVNHPDWRGNGVTCTFEQGSPITTIFGGPEGGVDYDFGAAAGNGPYLGDSYAGARFIFEFPEPVTLTSILLVNGQDSSTHGKWTLQALDPGQSTGEVGDNILDANNEGVSFFRVVFTNSNNGIFKNTGSDNMGWARGRAALGRKWNANEKLYMEFDYMDTPQTEYFPSFGSSVLAGAAAIVGAGTFARVMSNGDVFDGAQGLAGHTQAGFEDYPQLGVPLCNIGNPRGKRIAWAFHPSARKLWVKVAGGNWNGNPSADPATGVGGVDPFADLEWYQVNKATDGRTIAQVLDQNSPFVPWICARNIDSIGRFYLKRSDLQMAIPAGFAVIDATGGTWTDIGPETEMKYPGVTVNNSLWGGACEFRAGVNSLRQAKKFCIKCTTAGNGGRIFNDAVFGILGSPLQGGPRARLILDAEQTNFVDVTATFPMVYVTPDGSFDADQTSPGNEKWFQGVVSGLMQTVNGGGDGDQIGTVLETLKLSSGTGQGRGPGYLGFKNTNDPAGRFFQFRFARGVDLQAIQMVLRLFGDSYEVYSGGEPTKWGRWKVSFADNSNGPFTDANGGQSFAWPEYQWLPMVPIQGDGQPHAFWRLTKVSGTQISSGAGISQFNFLLKDIGPRSQLPMIFTDEDGLNLGGPLTISEPTETDPFKVTFRDDGGLELTKGLTIKPNIKFPPTTISDEFVFEVFSELSPRPLPTYNFYQKGRV